MNSHNRFKKVCVAVVFTSCSTNNRTITRTTSSTSLWRLCMRTWHRRNYKISSIEKSLKNLEFTEHASLSMRQVFVDQQFPKEELQKWINHLKYSVTYSSSKEWNKKTITRNCTWLWMRHLIWKRTHNDPLENSCIRRSCVRSSGLLGSSPISTLITHCSFSLYNELKVQ